jgi:hypothetical protein
MVPDTRGLVRWRGVSWFGVSHRSRLAGADGGGRGAAQLRRRQVRGQLRAVHHLRRINRTKFNTLMHHLGQFQLTCYGSITSCRCDSASSATLRSRSACEREGAGSSASVSTRAWGDWPCAAVPATPSPCSQRAPAPGGPRTRTPSRGAPAPARTSAAVAPRPPRPPAFVCFAPPSPPPPACEGAGAGGDAERLIRETSEQARVHSVLRPKRVTTLRCSLSTRDRSSSQGRMG